MSFSSISLTNSCNSLIAGNVAFDILPGSDDVWNHNAGKWETLSSGPNYAPNMAYIGWGVYVMATVDSDSNKRKAAWSAAAHIGKKQATTEELKNYVISLQSYFRGEAIDVGTMESPIRWIDPKVITPVPIDIACTGPKTIAMACDIAERVTFAVGSATERVSWAMQTALERIGKTGRNRDDFKIGAYVNLVCDPDEKKAISMARMLAGLVAHFTAMKNAPTEHLPDQLKPITEKLKTDYDMKNHSSEKGDHLDLIDDEFIDWFSIAGPPQKCIDRLGELIELGLDHIYLLGGSPVPEPRDARLRAMVEQTEMFAKEVLPSFK